MRNAGKYSWIQLRRALMGVNGFLQPSAKSKNLDQSRKCFRVSANAGQTITQPGSCELRVTHVRLDGRIELVRACEIVYRIENGRIVGHWMEFDRLGLLQQIQSASAGASK